MQVLAPLSLLLCGGQEMQVSEPSSLKEPAKHSA